MERKAFIFIGSSGCGKGTQANLLIKVLREKDSERQSFYIQTGQELREFITGNNFTQKLTKKIIESGGLLPEFMAIHVWTNKLANLYNGTDHLIFDGTPRKIDEARVLHSVFGFYGIDKPVVIHLNVSEEWSMKRLIERKRMDDNEEDIKKRLAWYKTDVIPAINFYASNNEYKYLEINGERPIEVIHADIVKRIFE